LEQDEIHGGHLGTDDFNTYFDISGDAGHSVFNIYRVISGIAGHGGTVDFNTYLVASGTGHGEGAGQLSGSPVGGETLCGPNALLIIDGPTSFCCPDTLFIIDGPTSFCCPNALFILDGPTSSSITNIPLGAAAEEGTLHPQAGFG